MGYRLLQIVVFFLAVVSSLAWIDPEVYFKSVLPNTPIPKSIIDSLITADTNKNPYLLPDAMSYIYKNAESDECVKRLNMSLPFFLENDIYPGKTIKVHLSKDTTGSAFLPRQVADLMPFTSGKLEEIFKAISVNPNSQEAKLIEKTVRECDESSNQEGDHYCATSLESMVDYITSKLGKRVEAISSHVIGNESMALQEYKVKGVKKLAINNAIVCHRQYYPYAVHYCHRSGKINTYLISLVGQNNLRANAISMCHEKESGIIVWGRAKHLTFKLLNESPGTTFICNFIDEDEIAWVPY